MSRVFVTGDTHYKEEYQKVERLCEIAETNKDDFLIILGDHGVDFWGPSKDRPMKRYLESLPISFVLVHGNHNQRPSKKICNLAHVRTSCISGMFYINPDYPSILYPKICGHYKVLGENAFIMGGAYSVDKHFRLSQQEMGDKRWRWFYDEQMTSQERFICWQSLHEKPSYKYMFTHTCPLKYIPNPKLYPDADKTMETFFGEVQDKFPIEQWYCGHHHMDMWSLDGKLRFMYNDVILLGDTEDGEEKKESNLR